MGDDGLWGMMACGGRWLVGDDGLWGMMACGG